MGLDSVDVFAAINRAVAEAGSQQAFAQRVGVSRQFIGQVLNAAREPTDAILAAAGLQRVILRGNAQ